MSEGPLYFGHPSGWLPTTNTTAMFASSQKPLPEDGHLSGLRSVMLDSTDEVTASPSTLAGDEDLYNTQLSGSQWMTKQETVRQTVLEQQSHWQPGATPPTMSWPPSGSTTIDEFNTEGYMSCAFPTLFPTGATDFLAPRPLAVTIGKYLDDVWRWEIC